MVVIGTLRVIVELRLFVSGAGVGAIECGIGVLDVITEWKSSGVESTPHSFKRLQMISSSARFWLNL